MMQPDRDLAGEGFGFQVNPLIGAAMVGVLHDIAAGLGDRQLRPRRYLRRAATREDDGKKCARIRVLG